MNIVTGIIVGTFVFVLGQYFLKLVLEPAVELRKIIASVAAALTEYANLYSNAGATHEFLINPSIEASKNIRHLAAQLRAQDYVVVDHHLVRRILTLPPRNDVIEATSVLIGLSNSFPGMSVGPSQGPINIHAQDKIERLLRIHREARPVVAAHHQLNNDIRNAAKRVFRRRRESGSDGA